MAFTTIQSSIYNNYLSSADGQHALRPSQESHDRASLRESYRSMLKSNTTSPLYLIPNVKQAANSAIELKEMTSFLRNEIASMGGLDDGLLNQRTAYSTNNNLATVQFLGFPKNAPQQPAEGEAAPEAQVSQIEVRQLASGQTNVGQFLPSNHAVSLKTGTYSFDVNIRNASYEFQFSINKNDTNKDVQKRLSRLINNAGVGLTSSVLEGNGSHSALQIKSESVGLTKDATSIFQISDENTSKEKGAVDYFGLAYTAVEPVNAIFVLDGQEQMSPSNTFKLDDMYEVTLTGISEDASDVTSIGLKKDSESLKDNMTHLFESYNAFLQVTSNYSESNYSFDVSRFQSDLTSISHIYADKLAEVGAMVQEDGSILLDTDKVDEAASSDTAQEKFEAVRDFAKALVRKSGQISLDPMHYTMKKVVAYKNPTVPNYVAPYIASNYAGLLYNFRC
ncbi:MAG: hypothetical protein K6G23_02325 [Lachnospiraceae bacterium]|nr:hypothetical protein [Lachnospiraceae bacterium]